MELKYSFIYETILKYKTSLGFYFFAGNMVDWLYSWSMLVVWYIFLYVRFILLPFISAWSSFYLVSWQLFASLFGLHFTLMYIGLIKPMQGVWIAET